MLSWHRGRASRVLTASWRRSYLANGEPTAGAVLVLLLVPALLLRGWPPGVTLLSEEPARPVVMIATAS